MKKLWMLTLMALIATVGFTPNAEAKGHKGKRMEKMFERKDTNGDGVVSKAEFTAHAEKHFAEVDANNDGNITKDEAKAHHKARKAKHKEMKKERKELKKEMKEKMKELKEKKAAE